MIADTSDPLPAAKQHLNEQPSCGAGSASWMTVCGSSTVSRQSACAHSPLLSRPAC